MNTHVMQAGYDEELLWPIDVHPSDARYSSAEEDKIDTFSQYRFIIVYVGGS